MSLKVRPLQPEDVRRVVEIHIRAFPGFFLTFLGPRFLRLFYRSFTEDPTGIGFVACDEEGGEPLGVVAGPLVPAGYFKRLVKRRWISFGLASIGAVLRRPSSVKRLARALFYRGDPPEGDDKSLLSSIAVAPEAQGRGAGKALVGAWLAAIKERGSPGAYLTTDADNNEATNAFYSRLGWEVESTYETPEGRRMNRYVWAFARECGSAGAENSAAGQ